MANIQDMQADNRHELLQRLQELESRLTELETAAQGAQGAEVFEQQGRQPKPQDEHNDECAVDYDTVPGVIGTTNTTGIVQTDGSIAKLYTAGDDHVTLSTSPGMNGEDGTPGADGTGSPDHSWKIVRWPSTSWAHARVTPGDIFLASENSVTPVLASNGTVNGFPAADGNGDCVFQVLYRYYGLRVQLGTATPKYEWIGSDTKADFNGDGDTEHYIVVDFGVAGGTVEIGGVDYVNEWIQKLSDDIHITRTA